MLQHIFNDAGCTVKVTAVTPTPRWDSQIYKQPAEKVDDPGKLILLVYQHTVIFSIPLIFDSLTLAAGWVG